MFLSRLPRWLKVVSMLSLIVGLAQVYRLGPLPLRPIRRRPSMIR